MLRRLELRPWCGAEGLDERDVREYVLDHCRIIPDAYRIQIEHRREGWHRPTLVVEFLEVIVTHRLPHSKIEGYLALWWALDSTARVHMRLHTVDEFGNLATLLDSSPWALTRVVRGGAA